MGARFASNAEGAFGDWDLGFVWCLKLGISAIGSASNSNALWLAAGCFLSYYLRLSQLPRFFRRGAHGVDQRATDFPFFQFMKSFDSRAAGTGDHVFERARMLAGFEHHPRAA